MRRASRSALARTLIALARPSSMFVPEWPPRPPSAETATAMEPGAAADRSPSRWTHVSVLPAQPTVSVPSSSLSRFSRIFPVSSAGSRPLAPSRPTSSATVISSSSGPCGSDVSSASAIMAAIATPSSAPSVVPSAVSHSPSRSRAIRPSAGSLDESGFRSHTMSRCPWSTTVGADSRPAVAGTRTTMLRAASERRSKPRESAQRSTCAITGSSCREGRAIAVSSSKRCQNAAGSSPLNTELPMLIALVLLVPGDSARAAFTTTIAHAMKSTGISTRAATRTQWCRHHLQGSTSSCARTRGTRRAGARSSRAPVRPSVSRATESSRSGRRRRHHRGGSSRSRASSRPTRATAGSRRRWSC